MSQASRWKMMSGKQQGHMLRVDDVAVNPNSNLSHRRHVLLQDLTLFVGWQSEILSGG
jgi:hypothetical protein